MSSTAVKHSPLILTAGVLAMVLLAPALRAAQADGDAQPGIARLDVELSPREITVGDRLRARLTLVWTGQEPPTPPRFPTWGATWGEAEVLSIGDVEVFSDDTTRRIYRQSLELTAFRTGEVRLPPVSIAIPGDGGGISHPEVSFAVRSVLPADTDTQLTAREAAPLLALAPGQRFVWTVAALSSCTLLMIWLLAHRLTRVTTTSPILTQLEPVDELVRRLAGLDPAGIEPAHTGLSAALRHFLGRCLDFPASESTTHEIGGWLGQTAVSRDIAEQTLDLLRDCDEVKFAATAVDAELTAARLAVGEELGRAIDHEIRPADEDLDGVSG